MVHFAPDTISRSFNPTQIAASLMAIYREDAVSFATAALGAAEESGSGAAADLWICVRDLVARRINA